MKKIFLLTTSAALLLLAGCAKESGVAGNGSGDSVTFTVTTENATSKAVADNDGHAAGVNHWIMEVRDGDGNVYSRQEDDAEAGTLSHSFTVKLVKGQTYQALFWADTKGTYDVTDLTGVKLLSSELSGYEANKDSRDAFSAVDDSFTFTGVSQRAVTLRRPFAQLNVIFTDIDEIFASAIDSTEFLRYKPCSLKVVAKVPTSFNVKTQTAGDPAATALNITAAENYLNNYCSHRAEETLFMDYFFASADSRDVVNINFSFSSNDVEISHDFTYVPFQRNYRTNIKGDLMSNTATWNVDIDADWTGVIENKDYAFECAGEKYPTLAAAVAAASAEDTVRILKAGTYALCNIDKNIIVKGAVSGVQMNCEGGFNTSIASIPNGASFENISFSFGDNSNHGFFGAGKISFKDCALNGLLYGYGELSFDACTFNQETEDVYALGVYGSPAITCTGCHFYGTNKAILMYAEGPYSYDQTITVSSCDFHASSSEDLKAAVQLNAYVNYGGQKCIVNISESTIEGFQNLYGFKHSPSQVSATVTVDGQVVYNQ